MNASAHRNDRRGPAEFRRQVRIAAVQAAGLGAEELGTALAYELEPESGIPASEAEVEFTPVADPDSTVCVYDVVVRRRRARTGAGAAKWLRVATLFAVAVLAAIAADWWWTSSRIKEAKSDVAKRQPLDARLKAERRAAHSSSDEARKVRERREAAVEAQDAVAERRRAWGMILTALGTACGDNAIIREISSPEPFAAEIAATAISAQAAADAMAALTEGAGKVGWRCEPGNIAERKRGSIVEFSFKLLYGGRK